MSLTFPLRSFLQFFTRNRYRKEMVGILVIKISALMMLWYYCFSTPLPKEQRASELAKHFVVEERYR